MFDELTKFLGNMTRPDKCPHCGETALIKKTKHKRFPYYVYCTNCGCRTTRWTTAAGAIMAWNRRNSND